MGLGVSVHLQLWLMSYGGKSAGTGWFPKKRFLSLKKERHDLFHFWKLLGDGTSDMVSDILQS